MATLDDLEKILIKIEKNTGGGRSGKSGKSSSDKEKKVKDLETVFTSFIKKFERQVTLLSNTIKVIGGYKASKSAYKEISAFAGSGKNFDSLPKNIQAQIAPFVTSGGSGRKGLSKAAAQALGQFNPQLLAGGAEAAGGEAAGGEAAAGGGLLKVAASNPYAAAGIAVAALVAGLVVAGPILKSWSKSLLDSQENLKQFSGAMASVFNRKEIFETLQNMRVGEATAGSAGTLEDAYENLSIALEPATILLTNIWNNGVAILVNLVAAMIETVQSYMQWMVDLLTELIKLLSFGNKTISDWLEKTYNANKKSQKISPFEAFARSVDPQVRLGIPLR